MGLLDTIVTDEREESVNIIIDSDSLVYKSAYRFKEKWDVELAYLNFAESIGKIRNRAYSKGKKVDDLIICLSSKKNFRYDIYKMYKHNRKNKDEDAQLLSDRVSELKKLIVFRIKSIVLVDGLFEADDYMYYYSKRGYLLSAIDSDVKNQALTEVYDYDKDIWFPSNSQETININILIYSLAGKSKDGVVGVKGIGIVKATKIVNDITNGDKVISDYVELFETADECLINVRLVSLMQIESISKIKLHTIEDVFDMFNIDEF